jgi:DNA-binding response OmpR family regulator
MGGQMKKKTCLVIDDSPLVLAMATDALESAGFDVIATDFGIEANQVIYRNPPPDIILIDVMMPLLSGDQKVKLIKERERSRNIPILLISSKSQDELEELTRTSGANGYIQKPFDAEKLVTAVRNILNEQE